MHLHMKLLRSAIIFTLILLSPLVANSEVIFNEGGVTKRVLERTSNEHSKWVKQRNEERRQRELAYASRGKMNDAEVACSMMIDDPTEYHGCKAGLEITKGNIREAEVHCGVVLGTGDQLSYQACKAGTLLARGDIEGARSKCNFFVSIQDALNGCRSGFAMVDGNFPQAKKYCQYILSLPGRNGCLAGYYLAQGDTTTAMKYCSYTIQHKYIYWDCKADVYSAMWSEAQQRSSVNYSEIGSTADLQHQIAQTDQKIAAQSRALAQEKAEMQGLIREIEQNPELLKDPEIRQIYNQFKSTR